MYRLVKSTNFRSWLAIVGAATLVIGASYTMVQQATRLGANDQPLATAQSTQSLLEAGASPADVVSNLKINLADNNNVFVIIADDSRHVLASSAQLNGQTPLPPQGTFDYTQKHGSDHFTWEPANSVRLATEILHYGQNPNSGYIITGQSLKPYEDRIDTYTELALAAWLAVLAWTFLILLMPETSLGRRTKA
jgi:hypothetical protein